MTEQHPGRKPSGRLVSGAGAVLVWLLTAAAALGDPARAAPNPAEQTDSAAWRLLAPGLELATFTVGSASIQVLRSDPERWQTVALAVSELGGAPRAARAGGAEFGLTAVINAGMYGDDLRTHTGHFRTGDHVNNPRWNQKDYRQAACFEPRESGLPRFVLMDLDMHPPAAFADRYDIVIQNIRLIRKPGENRWPPDTRPWSEACLGEDDQGRMLWIYCRQPHSMHAFIEILLALPLALVAAQHLEGGLQAQLWVASTAPAAAVPPHVTNGHQPPPLAQPGWPVPNVLGLRPRAAADR